jgi:hypothetical protein
MTDLAELRQRVKLVGARFRGTAEEDRNRSERLSSLLSLIEEGFARSQHEIKRLHDDLARASEERQQLQAMLQGLLAEGEDTGARVTGTAMRDLEDQVNRLVETVSSIGGTGSRRAPEMTKDSVAAVNTDADDRTAAGPEIGTKPATGPSEEVSEEAPTVAEEVEGKPVRKLDSDAREAGESPGTEGGEEKEPLELTQMVTQKGAVVEVNADHGQPTEKDRGAAQQIIKRVSLLTGTLREERNKPTHRTVGVRRRP